MEELVTDQPTLVVQTEWLTLEEAIRRTGKSQSTIERWVAKGLLGSKLEKRVGRKPERLYQASEVAKLAQFSEAGTGTPRALMSLTARPHEPSEIALSEKTLTQLSEVAAKWAGTAERPHVPLTEILWLTLRQASVLSGIPPTALKALVIEGKIVSCRFGRSLRIRRKSLQAFGD